MGQEQFCDFCRADIPIPESVKPVIIGKAKVGDACIRCASAFETAFKKQIAETEARFKAASAPEPAAPQQPAAKEQPEQPGQSPAPQSKQPEQPANIEQPKQ